MVTLIIVESPAKAKKIQSFFKGNEYIVKSSCGHIRDLHKKKLSIDIEKKFKPSYFIIPDKQKTVKQLKSIKADNVILAADDDREGDAIAWHCGCILGLDFNLKNRITFTEITKPAIMKALQNPKKIDMNSVNSQQTRRILDRLIGFKVSPLLWKHIQTDKSGLSAGRVQSCLLNILKKKETEINTFKPTYTYELNGIFQNENTEDLTTKFYFKKVEDLDDIYITRLMKCCGNERSFMKIKENEKE